MGVVGSRVGCRGTGETGKQATYRGFSKLAVQKLSKSNFFAICMILSLVYLNASGFLMRVVISRNKIPFLG